MNSILLRSGVYAQLLLSDAVIILIIWALEKGLGFRPELRRKQVVYEKIDLVRADRRDELIADLRERTGLNVIRCEVERIDFLRDTAEISVYYAGARWRRSEEGLCPPLRTVYLAPPYQTGSTP
nr:DUF4956 domain-containing protein [Methanofollis tationis]